MNHPITIPSNLVAFDIEGDYVVAFSEEEARKHWCSQTGFDLEFIERCEVVALDSPVHVEEADSPVIRVSDAIEEHVHEGGTFPTIIAYSDA